MKNSVLTISDGNGVDTDFKKWPYYLKLLLSKSATVVNKSIIGAGNEVMFMQLSDTLSSQSIDYAIIQWSQPQRFDVIVDEFWKNEAAKDETYSFNVHKLTEQEWWVSSASKNNYVLDYHGLYVKHQQAIYRSQSYMIAAAELLRYHGVKFVFSLCYKFEFNAPHENILRSYPWVWHQDNLGLNEFRNHSQYFKYDTGLPRPHTLIQLDWIDKVLRPNCEFIDYDQTTYYNIEQAILKNV